MNAPVRLPRKASGERPVYFDDPAVDKLLSITLALAGEVAVLRDRLDSLERVLDSRGLAVRAAIEDFRPDAAASAERDAWRERFLESVLRVVQQEREDLERRVEAAPYDAAVRLVEDDGPAA
jgi:hypothetical protein